MRSLTLKLTLAFVLVGLAGIVLLAILVGIQTRREFDEFIDNRYQTETVEALADYYRTNGGWSGVETLLPAEMGRNRRMMPLVLTDAQGTVVSDSRGGSGRGMEMMSQQVAIEVDGVTVGYVNFPRREGRMDPRLEAETLFLERIRNLVTISAAAAAALALLLGVALAQTITRPVRELTAATKAVAGGELGRQVPIQSRDELGELATAFNQMSSDLAHGQQTRRQMTADIAHDLRTPLTVILGYTEALSDGVLPGDSEMFGAMHQQAQHLSRLIEDLRTLSLADAGQLSLQPQPVAPRELLEQTAAAYGRQAEERGISLSVSADGALPLVRADADRLLQVMGNLVSNALRYTPRGGEVVLAAATRADQVQLRVSDTGPGIAADDLPFVFDRFYRADKARAADGASGLGLAIVRSLVEANGGRVAVESAPGAGATFIVSLPALV